MENENCNNDRKDSDSPLRNEDVKKELYLYSLRKMAERNAQASRIALTDLMGTNAFFYKANEVMHNNPILKYALIRMDLYRFKTVNEFCGREAGDKLLQFIADCFRVYESENTAVGHLRADIFSMCMPFNDRVELVEIVTDINEKISSYKLSCKLLPAFGICIQDNIVDISLMGDYANLALQRIKGKVFSYYSFYDEELREKLLYEKKIENEIIDAIKTRQIEVFIQPKVDMGIEKIIGGEALVRWNHPGDGYLMPSQFIPVLEKSGYIIDVDMYVWNEVFKALRKWIDKGYRYVPVSVNVSRMHVYQKDFKEKICFMSEKYGVDPALVKLEITENAFEGSEESLFESMKFLREKGFDLSMDDFGSGYSSMNMLKDEPVDEVKLDRQFLVDMKGDKGRIIVRNVIRMIKELGIDMIAEGVETREQADFLIECGCYKAQGFFYYKPMPMEKFEYLIKDTWNLDEVEATEL